MSNTNKYLFWGLMLMELIALALIIWLYLLPADDGRGALSLVLGIYVFIPGLIAFILILVCYLINTFINRKILEPEDSMRFKFFCIQLVVLVIMAIIVSRIEQNAIKDRDNLERLRILKQPCRGC